MRSSPLKYTSNYVSEFSLLLALLLSCSAFCPADSLPVFLNKMRYAKKAAIPPAAIKIKLNGIKMRILSAKYRSAMRYPKNTESAIHNTQQVLNTMAFIKNFLSMFSPLYNAKLLCLAPPPFMHYA